MGSLQLPVELTDRIIDFCHDDKRTLSNCALTHSSWLPASHFHLFHVITLDAQVDADRANQLKSFIHEKSLSHRRSSVLSYIRVVKIELLPSSNGVPQLGNTHCITHMIRQLCDSESLPAPSVHVSLAKLSSGPESCIALSTFPLVGDIVTHVRLADASFADGNDIWPFLSSFPRLQCLELSKIGFDDYSRPALPSERIFDGVPLSKLRITTAFMGFIISSLITIADSLNYLEDFGVTYQDIRQARLPQLAEVIQSRVRRLRFNASCYPGPRRSMEIRPSVFNTRKRTSPSHRSGN